MSPGILVAVVLGLGPNAIVAQHDVSTVGDDRIVVQTRWSGAAVGGGTGTIALVTALPEGAQVEGATPQHDEDGRVIGLVLDDPRSPWPSVRVSVDWSTAVAAGALPVPVAAHTEIQRITVDDAITFRPDPALELEVALGHTLPIGMTSRERVEVDARLGRARPRLGAIYVTTGAIERNAGLVGTVEARAVGRRRTVVVAGGVFIVLCGVAALGYRRARRSAEAEHADLVLAAEFDGLGAPSNAPKA